MTAAGSGFTGVLACVGGGVVRLITAIGAAPACPIGSSCLGNWGGCSSGGCDNGWGNNFASGGWGLNGGFDGGFGGGCFGVGMGGGGFAGNWLGAVAEIPICKIVTFTHNALT